MTEDRKFHLMMTGIFGGAWVVGFLAALLTGAPVLAALMCGVVLDLAVVVLGALWGMSDT